MRIYQDKMTVAELIKYLQSFNQNLQVFVGSCDCYPTVGLETFTVLRDGKETEQIALSITAAI